MTYDDSMPDARSVTGQVKLGLERISMEAAGQALGLNHHDKELAADLTALMRLAGWRGPTSILLTDSNGKTVKGWGYCREPLSQQGDDWLPGDIRMQSAERTADDLPAKLERTTRLALRQITDVLKLPMDKDNAGLLRAKVTSAGIAINAQLRADEQRLKRTIDTDVMSRLLKIIEAEKKNLGKT